MASFILLTFVANFILKIVVVILKSRALTKFSLATMAFVVNKLTPRNLVYYCTITNLARLQASLL